MSATVQSGCMGPAPDPTEQSQKLLKYLCEIITDRLLKLKHD